MTKKHFKALAAMMAREHKRLELADIGEDVRAFSMDEWTMILRGICEVCKFENSRFDAVRFIEACYPD